MNYRKLALDSVNWQTPVLQESADGVDRICVVVSVLVVVFWARRFGVDRTLDHWCAYRPADGRSPLQNGTDGGKRLPEAADACPAQ